VDGRDGDIGQRGGVKLVEWVQLGWWGNSYERQQWNLDIPDTLLMPGWGCVLRQQQ
jgi:hypothetical protein